MPEGLPRRVKRLFVPEGRLLACLCQDRGPRLQIVNLHQDALQVVGSEFEDGMKGVWLVIFSPLFPAVPAGEPVPEFEAEWLGEG
jgi:hypothetical protein